MLDLVEEKKDVLSKETLKKIANALRALAIDATQAANSGHPGLPLGCADIMAVLYAECLAHYPKEADWFCRDRFVLSAGHGSMLLYGALHLSGFDVSMQHLKDFRQWGSPSAGHPEYGHLEGVECTTGPLGQGLGMAVGMALSQQMFKARFDHENNGLFDCQTYCLAGDGDLMEGVASEAASLAGHLALSNLVLIYDSNDICLDGETKECFTENVSDRFKAYNWDVLDCDGHCFDSIRACLKQAKQNQEKPTLIVAKTTIGYGAKAVEGTSAAHGKVLGESLAKETKAALGIHWPDFSVPDEVLTCFKTRLFEQEKRYQQWQKCFSDWQDKHQTRFETMQAGFRKESVDLEAFKTCFKAGSATRSHSGALLQEISKAFSYVVGGSADLSSSDQTFIKGEGIVSKETYAAKNIKFGVREFAMAAMSNGIALHGYFKPYCGTFFVFSDYMKNAMRLAALMNLPVVYQLTHDSIFLGEDGPTHQPIEQLASLRATPNLIVIRPADEHELLAAWHIALNATGPVALVLTRQNVPLLEASSYEKARQGAYVVFESDKKEKDVLLIATGSEVALALDVASQLESKGVAARVVSMPSWELFEQQSDAYKGSVLGDASLKVSIEAASSMGWHRYVGDQGLCVSIDGFGASGKASDLALGFGFDAKAIVDNILKQL